jgi:hypothetical protein
MQITVNNSSETHQATFNLTEDCVDNLLRNICNIFALNEAKETLITSTYLIVTCLDFKFYKIIVLN